MGTQKVFAILSGPSGVGKGPLQEVVTKFYPGLIDAHPILCTSRPARQGEIHGKHYYFLPFGFIKSLDASPDFAVSPVRSDLQAIHLPQVEDLLQSNDLVFAEVYYTFGPALLQQATSRDFKSVRIFLLPLSYGASLEQLIAEMKAKLDRRGTDLPEEIENRASSAPDEIEKATHYTHCLVNPAGEDDASEWKCYATCGGKKQPGKVNSVQDLGPNARWLVETFVGILKGNILPGEYSR